jgi:hypothetical protein
MSNLSFVSNGFGTALCQFHGGARRGRDLLNSVLSLDVDVGSAVVFYQ